MTTKKLLLAAVFSLSFLAFGSDRAMATIDNVVCRPDETVFLKVGKAHSPLDIRKTVQNMIVTAITDTSMGLAFNRNPSQAVECSYDAIDKAGLDNLKSGLVGVCTITASDSCDDFTETYDANKLNYKINQTGGSLLGIANTLEGATRTEPVPVNLAYYWNDQIKDVPFAAQALAAEVQYGNIGILSTILALWKTFRNIAFGILSVVMLVIGIMIMTRKKLSPQLSVTAQYALPRIVLAVILIVFSYPIGAVLASSMRYLARLGENIVCNAPFNPPGPVCPVNIGLLLGAFIIAAIIATTISGGIGVPLFVALAVVILIVLVLNIAIFVRGLLLLVKLIFSIVFAPVVFAVGAIPGNEASTQNYLKQWVSYVGGYIGMFVYAAVVNVVVLLLITGPVDTFTGDATSFLAIIFGPIILIFGYMQALKMPGKVQNMIMGDPRKPGGRK